MHYAVTLACVQSCTSPLSFADYFVVLVECRYAIRDGNKIKIFKNFKERKAFKPEYGAESKDYFDQKMKSRQPAEGLSSHTLMV